MNNKFGDCCNCPALEDGRFLTRYDDRIELDLEIMKKNNITDSLVLRKFLIDNASNIMASNISDIETTSKCNYNKPINAPALPVDSAYYINGAISEPSDTQAPFNIVPMNLDTRINTMSPS